MFTISKCNTSPSPSSPPPTTAHQTGFVMYGEQMWVVLNVVEPGMDQNALVAVER